MLNIFIRKAQLWDLEDCKKALLKSKLGQEYFTDQWAQTSLTEGITKEEIYVAADAEGAVLGFIWFVLKGAFHFFPYAHLIAVKEQLRSKGIGKKLLSFFEETVFKDYSKVFFVVADFNPEAKRLYERVGYVQVGAIPGLYKEGVTEYLMMKVRGVKIRGRK
jgi:ribosomal protein S18 acetylase RimI-like enzyme